MSDSYRADMPVPAETWEAFLAIGTPYPLPVLYEHLLAHPELVDPVTLEQIESRLRTIEAHPQQGQVMLNILTGLHEARRIGIARFTLGLHRRSVSQEHLQAVYMKVHLPETALPESIRTSQDSKFLAEVAFITRLLHDADDHDQFGAMIAPPPPPRAHPPDNPTEEQRREMAWVAQFPGLGMMLNQLFSAQPSHWSQNLERMELADQTLARLDPQAVPFTWSSVQRIRAQTLLSGGFGDHDKNYRMAAEALRRAMEVFAGFAYPGELAMLRISLAELLMDESGPDRSTRIEDAITCYQAAERDVPPEASLHVSAVLQHAWGIALRDRIAGDRVENLREARRRITRARTLFAAIPVMPPGGEMAVRIAAHDYLGVLRELAAISDEVSGDDLAAAEYEAAQQPLPEWMQED